MIKRMIKKGNQDYDYYNFFSFFVGLLLLKKNKLLLNILSSIHPSSMAYKIRKEKKTNFILLFGRKKKFYWAVVFGVFFFFSNWKP